MPPLDHCTLEIIQDRVPVVFDEFRPWDITLVPTGRWCRLTSPAALSDSDLQEVASLFSVSAKKKTKKPVVSVAFEFSHKLRQLDGSWIWTYIGSLSA